MTTSDWTRRLNCNFNASFALDLGIINKLKSTRWRDIKVNYYLSMLFVIIVTLAVVAFFVLLLGWSVPIANTSPSTQDVPSPPKDPSPPPPKDTSLSRDKVSQVENVNKINLIQIMPSSCYLSPGEEKIFKVKATNKMGSEINPGLMQWQATGGTIDSQGKLIVDPRSKGTFKVTVISPVDNLTYSVDYTVLPKLTSIEIITTKEIVMPGQDVCLELRGTDQTQAEINIEGQPIWSTTTGEISSKRKLVVDLPNRIVYITAKIRGLEAKATVRVGECLHKVVDSIYPIDIPDPSPTPSPNPNPIPIPTVPDPEDELYTNEPEQIKESSRLVALEIDAPELLFLKPSQERVFTVYGIDQFGEYIDPGKILWRATGGAIDSQGKLIIEEDAKGSFRVTAISSKNKVSQHRLRQNLLLIKVSLKIFSWVLSHKRFVKNTAFYLIQDFCDSEVFVNKIFPDIDTSNIDGLLTILVFDDIKEWIIEAAIDIIINYLDEFINLCFLEEPSLLTSSVDYIVLPELKKLTIKPSDISIKPGEYVDFQLIAVDQKGDKIDINRKVNWRATGGSIDSRGKLTVNPNSQGIYKVEATVGNKLNVSINYNTLHSQEISKAITIFENRSDTLTDCNILAESSNIHISSSTSSISSSHKKKETNDRRKISYGLINKQRANLGSERGSFGYTDREEVEEYSSIKYAPVSVCPSSWFYKSQLFYDGYSAEDMMSYTDYLEYRDVIDYYSY